jgi:hypothetical protein
LKTQSFIGINLCLDITAMMMACSDLSTPKEAKSFKTKTAVKDVEPHHKSATFQQSEKARQWSTDSEQLSELFTLPAATTGAY